MWKLWTTVAGLEHGGHARRATTGCMRSRLFGALCIGTGPRGSGPQGHDPRNSVRACVGIDRDIVVSVTVRTTTTTTHHHPPPPTHPHIHTTTPLPYPPLSPPPPPPGAILFKGDQFILVAQVCWPQRAVVVMAARDDAGGGIDSARRRRERRLRSVLRCEQQSIRMALATLTHHSRTAPEDGQGLGEWSTRANCEPRLLDPPHPQRGSHGRLRGCLGSSPRGVVASRRRRRGTTPLSSSSSVLRSRRRRRRGRCRRGWSLEQRRQQAFLGRL